MSQSLTWNGDAITARMRQAQKLGVNATMEKCIVWSKANHTWKNQTGDLEATIQIGEYARDVVGGVEGVWGSKAGTKGLNYARIHEFGGVIVPKNATALKIPMPDGSFRFVKSVTIPARPYLRPSADVNYPELAANIKAAYAQLSGPSAPSQGAPN